MTGEDRVLCCFREVIAAKFGARLERLILFCSRARGDFTPDSDYDIAVFLRDMTDWWEETGPLSQITTDIQYDTGAVICAMPFQAGAYNDPKPLMREIKRDGVDL